MTQIRHDWGPVGPIEPTKPFNGLAIVGKMPCDDDKKTRQLFSGPAGDLLKETLAAAGCDFDACLKANAFRHRPQKNPNGDDILSFFAVTDARTPTNRKLPPYQDRYVRENYAEDVRILWRSLRQWQPKTVLILGGVGLWSLTGLDKISKYRGKWQSSQACPAPVMPTWDPAYVLRRKDDEPRDQLHADIVTAWMACSMAP